MRILPLLLPLLASACAPGRADWAGVPITSAWLDDYDLSTLAVVVGVVQGDAVLGFDGPAGSGALPVHLGGGAAGVLLELAGDVEGHRGPVPIDLSHVRDPTVGDVLGTYNGTMVGGAVIVGGERRRLRNGKGATLREDHFALGLGVFGGFNWVVVKPQIADAQTSSADSGSWVDTGTAPPTTTTTTMTTWDPGGSGPPTSDTGAGSAPSGCGCVSGRTAPAGVGALVVLLGILRSRGAGRAS